MKTIIKSLFLFFSIAFCLTSCRDNAEIPEHGPVMHPEKEVIGTYSGDWSRAKPDGSDETLATGTLTFSDSEIDYVTNIEAVCDELKLNMSSVANITPGGEGYFFSNSLNTNGFGAMFSGSIKKNDNTVWLSFKKTVKVGIKSTTYIYTFNGTKQ